MIVKASAPARISLFCGGTDLPSFTEKHTGIAISFAINLRTQVFLATGEDIFEFDNQIPYGADKTLFHSILNHYGLGGMHHCSFMSDTPAFVKSGLGTSASASVALIKAIAKTSGADFKKEQIAVAAFALESSLWVTGKQDIMAATYGGVNVFRFNNKGVERTGLSYTPRDIYLFYVGGERKDPQQELKQLTPAKEKDLLHIRDLAEKALDDLDDSERIGRLLDEAWEYKKKTNPSVANERINTFYEAAKKAGAWGGKVCGAGGAGYMIFMTDKKEQLIKAMSDLGASHIDYEVDYQGVEGRIL